MKKLYAVITGDIVASSKLDSNLAQSLGDIVANEIERSAIQYEKPWEIGFHQVFRGDSWQLCTSTPFAALTIATALRTSFRGKFGFDTRFSIGIGKADPGKNQDSVPTTGEAFQLSGKGLDGQSKESRQDISLTEDYPSIELFAKSICYLLDGLISNWTDKQCLAVSLAISGKANKELAKRFLPKAISEQAFGKHLSAANWNLVSRSLQMFESALSTQLTSR